MAPGAKWCTLAPRFPPNRKARSSTSFAPTETSLRGDPQTSQVIEHAMKIRSGSKPVKQHLCRFDEEKCRVIGEEIMKHLVAGFIKEVYHPGRFANPVRVKKKSGKWRMCVDYMGLNKACPKDMFPLPRIDQVVDSTSGCETLCFLNAYSGYHQITMKESDQLTTSFITPSDHSATSQCRSV